MTEVTAAFEQAPWSGWLQENLQIGLIILDQQARVVFVNRWFLRHAQISEQDILQRKLPDVFTQLEDEHFNLFLTQAMNSGFPALLSQTLHPAPFPLYQPGVQRGQDKLLRQSIRIIPMSAEAAQSAGQRYTMIQITDVTHTVLRERLLKAQANKLQSLVNIDVLTGLGNRRMLDEHLAHALSSAVRTRIPVALVMFDIDYFKQYNDTYGHLHGDACLRRVADVLRQVCRRPHDAVARFGGEEMVAILPETDLDGALAVAHEVLQQISLMQLPHSSSQCAPVVTLSAGVAVSMPPAHMAAKNLIDQADQALYSAKNLGRNRVASFSTA